jgi:hypothetical protein
LFVAGLFVEELIVKHAFVERTVRDKLCKPRIHLLKEGVSESHVIHVDDDIAVTFFAVYDGVDSGKKLI